MTTPNDSRIGGQVNGVAPGSLIVSRYHLEEALPSDLADVTAWAAHDRILDRAVRLSVLSGQHVTEALDSARRAALVADSRLSRVLDVGTDKGVPYVVTDLYGGKTLSDLVAGGILTPGQARTIVGEVATALDVAARRGVHHLALRPEAIRIFNGRVVVTGLGLDAGLAGIDQQDSERTSHADAVGLASLLYYSMTARWPGPPLEARWIAEQTIHPLPAQRDGTQVLSLAQARKDCPGDLVTLCDEVFAGGPPTTWDVETSVRGPQNVNDVITRLKPWGPLTMDAPPPPPIGVESGAVSRQSVRSAFDGASSAPPGTPPPAPPMKHPASGRVHRSTVASGAVAAVAAAADVSLPGAAGQQIAEAPLFSPTFTPLADAERFPEPKGRRFNPTAIVLVLAAVGIALGLFWALNNAFTGFTPPLSADPSATGKPNATATAEGGTNAGIAAEPTTTPEPADVRPVIESGEALDPDGVAAGDTKGEHPEAAPLAYDGQPETKWFTRTYRSANISGKSGIGYAIHLQQEATVTTIVLNTNDNGGNVQVRATSADKPMEGPILAEGPLSPDTDLTLSTPTKAKTFVLWFTEMPTTTEGKLRVEIKEILVS